MWRVTNKTDHQLILDNCCKSKRSGRDWDGLEQQALAPRASCLLAEPGPATKRLEAKGCLCLEELPAAELKRLKDKKDKELEIRRVRLLKAKVAKGVLKPEALPVEYRPPAPKKTVSKPRKLTEFKEEKDSQA